MPAEVVANRPLSGGHFLLSLRPKEAPQKALPGQFYMIGPQEGVHKKPFSLLRQRGRTLQFLLRRRGEFTAYLGSLPPGAVLELLGPLGRPYPAPPRHRHPLVLAGGVGIASLWSFLQRFGRRAVLLYGGRDRAELVLLSELRALVRKLLLATEDGSVGSKGTVVQLLEAFLKKEPPGGHILYACGPRGMLKALQGHEGWASFEAYMACGTGLCLGCALAHREGGFVRACREGPVFALGEVLLNEA